MTYPISARKIPHLLPGSSCYCLGQILDGAIDWDALELALVFFLPCKGMLPGKQH